MAVLGPGALFVYKESVASDSDEIKQLLTEVDRCGKSGEMECVVTVFEAFAAVTSVMPVNDPDCGAV